MLIIQGKNAKIFIMKCMIICKIGNIPERIRSYYEIKYGKNSNINELRTNSLLAILFIPVEMKHIEQVKKEKIKNFQKLSKKYLIKEQRLHYKYKVNNQIIVKKIPYINELTEIFYSSHIGQIHYGFEKSKKKY